MHNPATLQEIDLPTGPGGHPGKHTIGALLQELHGLTDDQVQQVLRYQQQQGLRFGDAAVALRLADHEDIVVLLARQFHFPVIPRLVVSTVQGRGLVADDPASPAAEAFRDLRTELIMQCMGPGQPGAALAVVSPASSDGKSFIAANLAAAFARLGRRVLLVDANLRRPGLASLFQIDEHADGLATLLGGEGGAVFHRIAGLPGLFVMTAGAAPRNPQELLQGPGFRRLLEEAVRVFDHVVVDSPACSLGSDYRTIAAATGLALAVARQDRTDLRAMQHMLGALENSDCRIAGVVLNRYR